MKKPLFLLAISIVLFSCSKNEMEPCNNSQSEQTSYYPLAVGNYWIYNRYNLLNDGSTAYSGQDSVVIVGDTLIDGSIYFQHEAYKSNGSPTSLAGFGTVRDSLGYIVNSNGTILFSDSDASDTLSYQFTQLQPFAWWGVGSMNLEPQTVSVEAGVFECLEHLVRIETDDEPAQVNFPKFDRTLHAANVGRVKFNINYFSGTSQILYELNDYHIEE